MSGLRFVLAASLTGVLLGGTALQAQDITPAFSGGDDFKIFCATCHGAGGKGDGLLATSLSKAPADLTQLAKANDGKFPFDQTVKIVDGREPVKGHGGKDMPAWGDALRQSQGSQTPEAVKARIEAIVRYLERIQQK